MSMKSILDPSFRYTASFDTDLRKTFARIRRDHRHGAEAATQPSVNALVKAVSTVGKSASGR
jgi:hypothetical protein